MYQFSAQKAKDQGDRTLKTSTKWCLYSSRMALIQAVWKWTLNSDSA